jgi:hypothetical protein
MQYTSKFVFLAAIAFSTSALAATFVPRDVVVESDLTAREFYNMYLEARAHPSIDARSLDAMDMEAREYLEYLEGRESTSASNKKLSYTSETISEKSTSEESSSSPSQNSSHTPVKPFCAYKLQGKKTWLATEKAAMKQKLKTDHNLYDEALEDNHNKLHNLAVKIYLASHTDALKKAAANKKNAYHHVAKELVKKEKAKIYLCEASNFMKALKHKHHKYHKVAVRQYLSIQKYFEEALADEMSIFHEQALQLKEEEEQLKHSLLKTPTATTTGTKSDTAESTHSTRATPTISAREPRNLESRWDQIFSL